MCDMKINVSRKEFTFGDITWIKTIGNSEKKKKNPKIIGWVFVENFTWLGN